MALVTGEPDDSEGSGSGDSPGEEPLRRAPLGPDDEPWDDDPFDPRTIPPSERGDDEIWDFSMFGPDNEPPDDDDPTDDDPEPGTSRPGARRGFGFAEGAPLDTLPPGPVLCGFLEEALADGGG